MRFKVSARFLAPALAMVAAVLGGCASTGRPVPALAEAAQAPVAAQFRTTVSHDRKASTSDWRYWRTANSVQREDLGEKTGDLWQRDGATLFHTLLFHEDRRGIEFEQVDLQMTGGVAPWEQQAQIVSPAVLAKLRLVKEGWRGEVPYRDYAGKIGEVRWQVRMRVDLMLPMRVEQRGPHDSLRIELIEAHALSDAPWKPTSSEGYGLLEFADLGDHERDPFVLRAQAHMGVGHGHAH
jgi:hypothetical protein